MLVGVDPAFAGRCRSTTLSRRFVGVWMLFVGATSLTIVGDGGELGFSFALSSCKEFIVVKRTLPGSPGFSAGVRVADTLCALGDRVVLQQPGVTMEPFLRPVLQAIRDATAGQQMELHFCRSDAGTLEKVGQAILIQAPPNCVFYVRRDNIGFVILARPSGKSQAAATPPTISCRKTARSPMSWMLRGTKHP